MNPLWKHQEEGAVRADLNGDFAFFMEMGTGKSRTVIETLKRAWNREKRIQRTLIFCPPIVITNWKAEWLKYSKVDREMVQLLTGPGPRRLGHFLTTQAKIVVTNYESLLMKELFEAFLNWKPEVVIFDESHKLKNPTARRSKRAARLTDVSPRPRVFLLSGSPVLNSPMDLFQQYLVLDGGTSFGENYFAFRAKFFVDLNAHMPKHIRFPKWEPRSLLRDGLDGVAAINEKIAASSMRVLKKDCLDLPPLLRQTIAVPMGVEQGRLYAEMAKDFITFMASGEAVTATLAITKALRLQQIASGFAKSTGGTEHELEDVPKLAALKELLSEIKEAGGKTLVWATFRENYRQIRKVCEDLKIEFVEVHGEVSTAERLVAVDRFNNDPSIGVYLGHPGSGGIGVNLVSAQYSIFYSRNFSLENDLQARARNHRGGSEIHASITHYDLVCENSIDEFILEKLLLKEAVGEKTIGSLQAYLKGV